MPITLGRRVNEIICIGADIQIMVTRISGEVCHLRVSAPREIPVHRKEVADRIARQGPQRRDDGYVPRAPLPPAKNPSLAYLPETVVELEPGVFIDMNDGSFDALD